MCLCVHVAFQSLKVLRTSEFLPYVVFLQSPEFEVLKAMNHSAVEAGVVTKTLTVRHAQHDSRSKKRTRDSSLVSNKNEHNPSHVSSVSG